MDLEGKRLDSWKQLTGVLAKPEYYMIAQYIESHAFAMDITVGEEYEKIVNSTISKLKDEEILQNLVSGIVQMKDLLGVCS